MTLIRKILADLEIFVEVTSEQIRALPNVPDTSDFPHFERALSISTIVADREHPSDVPRYQICPTRSG